MQEDLQRSSEVLYLCIPNEHSISMKVQDKRQAVLDTTLQMVVHHGFHAAPMAKIAKEAGVAAGTIYHHFKNKEDLIDQLYLQLKQKLGEALNRELQIKKTYQQQFFQFWMNLFDHYTQNPDAFFFLEQRDMNTIVSKAVFEQGKVYYQPVVAFLERGMEEGHLRSMHIALMTQLVYQSVIACVKLKLDGEVKLTKSMIKDAVQSAWDGVSI